MDRRKFLWLATMSAPIGLLGTNTKIEQFLESNPSINEDIQFDYNQNIKIMDKPTYLSLDRIGDISHLPHNMQKAIKTGIRCSNIIKKAIYNDADYNTLLRIYKRSSFLLGYTSHHGYNYKPNTKQLLIYECKYLIYKIDTTINMIKRHKET